MFYVSHPQPCTLFCVKKLSMEAFRSGVNYLRYAFHICLVRFWQYLTRGAYLTYKSIFYKARCVACIVLPRIQKWEDICPITSELLNILSNASRSYLIISLQIKNDSLFCKRRLSYFPVKTHVVGKIEINTAIVSQTWKFWIQQYQQRRLP